MLKAAPPPLPWVEETAPPPVGVVQAHFVSHWQFRLLDMHTVIRQRHRAATLWPSPALREQLRSSWRIEAGIDRDQPKPIQRLSLCR